MTNRQRPASPATKRQNWRQALARQRRSSKPSTINWHLLHAGRSGAFRGGMATGAAETAAAGAANSLALASGEGAAAASRGAERTMSGMAW